jgi:hypothetical protein
MNDLQLSAQVARDLYYIHENRIDAYRELLRDTAEVGLDLKGVIARMIEQSASDRLELKKRMKDEVDTPGEIYKSWQVMINPVTNSDKKTILNTLADDELIMMNTYSLALSSVTDKDMIALLQSQLQELKKLHAHLREFHDAQ